MPDSGSGAGRIHDEHGYLMLFMFKMHSKPNGTCLKDTGIIMKELRWVFLRSFEHQKVTATIYCNTLNKQIKIHEFIVILEKGTKKGKRKKGESSLSYS